MTTHKIDYWDIKRAIEIGHTVVERHGAKPYGFRFATMLVSPDIETTRGAMKVQPKTVRSSGMHFINGRIESYDEVVKRNLDSEKIMRSNMQCNGHWLVCITRNSYRSTMPFEEHDVVVDLSGNVVARGDDPKYVQYRAQRQRQYREELHAETRR